MLDNSDFADTDIPFEVPVPEKQHLPVSLEIREFDLCQNERFVITKGFVVSTEEQCLRLFLCVTSISILHAITYFVSAAHVVFRKKNTRKLRSGC